MEKNKIIVVLPFATIALLFGFLYLFSNEIHASGFGIQSHIDIIPSERHSHIGNTHNLANISSLWNKGIAGVRNIKISLLGDSTALRTTNGKQITNFSFKMSSFVN